MPISRRGLTAAGLALAAVAAVGVTSTLEAGAAQVGAPRLPATSVPALSDLSASDDTPPPPLPGADKPTASAAAAAKVSRFSAWQADTARVSGPRPDAARADAPPPPTSVDAPKGLPPLAVAGAAKPATALRSGIPPTTSSATALSAAAPPAPLAAAPAPSPTVKYFYATGEFNAVAAKRAAVDGATAMMTIGKPALHSRDSHSLAEIAVQSVNEEGKPDGRQVVEVGWTVDRQVNKKNPTEPHLFVYRWVNGDPTDGKGKHCYNSSECGFVPHDSATSAPGDKLTAGETKKFGIQHFENAWWIWYDKGWIGRYPDSIWGNTFTKVDHVQWFGEVAAGGATPCSEMGKGRSARSSGAARFYAINLLTNGSPNTKSTPTDVSVGTWPLALTYYDIYKPPPPTPSTPPSPPEDEPKPVNHFFYGGKGGDCS